MKMAPLELRPTQFVLGMHEVENKIEKLQSLGGDALKDWIKGHEVPCVVGPQGHFYMIDHHHFVAAVYHCGLDRVAVDIVADKQGTSSEAFWTFMKASDWLYLYDQFGHGPHDPSMLPLDIRGMADDPYRSLAWELRRAGLIEKVQRPFSEFRWAAYLRENLAVDLHESTYAEAVRDALALVKASDIGKRKVP